MSQNPFELNGQITAVVQEYGNCPGAYEAADCLFPVVPVCTDTFKYRQFDKTQPYDLVNQYVGRKSQVHEIDDYLSTLVSGVVEDYFLDYALPVRDSMQQNCTPCDALGFDLKAKYARMLVDQIKLGREKRAADLAFDAALFAASNKVTLGAGNEFNATGGGATNPLDFLGDLIAGALQPYNVMVMSLKTWYKIARNPAFLGNVDNRGVASKEGVAALLGLDKICITNAKTNTAASGSAPVIEDLVSDKILLAHVSPSFVMTDCPSATFGFTARMGDMVAAEYFDFKKGGLGANYLRVGMMEKMVAAYDQGYLISNAVV